MTDLLKFGVLSHGLHRPDQDPALQFSADLALAEHADRLGLDEVWWTERHSGGWQIVADPTLMVAHAAASTRRVRLGALVDPVRHHPANLVDGAAQLDHLTRGRFVLGLGTDIVADDGAAIGLSAEECGYAIDETVAAVAQLLRGRRSVSVIPRYAPWMLKDHTPQLLPRGRFDLRTLAFGAGRAPELAGRFGLGLVTPAVTEAVGLGREHPMSQAWQRAARAATDAGRSLPRERWSVTLPVHVAESEIDARRQVKHGIVQWAEYARRSMPGAVPEGSDADTLVDALHAAGAGVVGTPSMVTEHLARVLDLTEGAGTVLLELADWADPADTVASLERFAREVIPQLTGAARTRLAAASTHVASGGAGGRRAAGPPTIHAPTSTPVRGVTRVHVEGRRSRRGRHTE